ncbi:Zinc finger BED domain-containing protein 1 [Zootermopsis nevadensis]|uniref:Zinc finger BED domain-containing protein 1 n=1 Tax=Zootermopsis nevadensis TaxID=136037 RepID=A0A067R9Y6_ZOONE|nr:Zinc finger BED domain-containing protein 1 [Zootermopsis nevadensis]
MQIPNVLRIIENIRTIVSHFKSNNANEKLITYQQNNTGRQALKLIHDIPTRNSTYAMLELFALLEESLKATIALIDKHLPVLSSEDWKIIRELIQVLKPFQSLTKTMSGEKYATASLINLLEIDLKNVCNILLKKSFCKEVQQVIQCYLTSIQERFRSLEQSTTLMVCTIIDPRFKMLAFSDKQISENAKEKVITLVASSQP